MTDDRGEYRFAGLSDGKYILCANAGGGVIVNEASGPMARSVTRAPPTQILRVSLTFRKDMKAESILNCTPVNTVRVKGVVSGQPAGAGAAVSLIPRTQIARMSMGLSARVQADGSFVIAHVPPGSYTAYATADRISASVDRSEISRITRLNFTWKRACQSGAH